ncbi:LssY C-terminal domain-containing protein [Arsenicicoccus piscis]|nr:LssY C-terminal domain-containing protein [Arsenicicoccus piscis]MCH8627537.1 LssY C-terminal domain-containing protein [Arsenicicoccus piscis]
MSTGTTGRPPRKVIAPGHRHLLRLSVVENAFFVAATAFAFYFAYVIVRSGGNLLQHVLALLLFWAVLAYLALPRLNQILSAIYVPDYFMGRTRAGDGVLGDAVNVALRGTEDQVHTTMRQAGWSMADPVTLRSSWDIIVSAVAKRSYPTAPVSPLFLFGAMETFAYEQQVGGNASQRHHVRFWRTPTGWLLPGGHQVDWLAAASFDRAVGLSLFTLQVTHKIDGDIDVERDHVVDTVTTAEPAVSVHVIEDFSTGYHSRNGGGDVIHTDGNLPVLDLAAVTATAPVDPSQPDVSGPDRSRTDGSRPGSSSRRGGDVASRPPTVLLAAVLALVSTLAGSGRRLYDLLTLDPRVSTGLADAAQAATARTVSATLLTALGVGMLVLAFETYRGRSWARVGLLGVAAATLASHVGIGSQGIGTLADFAVDLAIMYTLTTTTARSWTGDVRRRPVS